jgi:hypothetical protein
VASYFCGKDADVVDATVTLGVVHAVADDELVGDFECYVVGFDGYETALGFVETGGDLQRRGLVLEHEAAEVAEGETSVENVFDQDHMFAFDRVVDVLDELDGSGRDAGAPIAGDSDEVEGVVDLDGAGEISEEDGGAFEDADENDGLAFIVGGDLCADLAGAVGDLLLGDENFHS